jgi:hypothetical protein
MLAICKNHRVHSDAAFFTTGTLKREQQMSSYLPLQLLAAGLACTLCCTAHAFLIKKGAILDQVFLVRACRRRACAVSNFDDDTTMVPLSARRLDLQYSLFCVRCCRDFGRSGTAVMACVSPRLVYANAAILVCSIWRDCCLRRVAAIFVSVCMRVRARLSLAVCRACMYCHNVDILCMATP